MDERTEQLEAEMRAIRPTAADDAWHDRVSAGFVDEPTRSYPIARWLIPLAAAACIVAAVSIFWPDASPTTQPSQPSQTVVLASGWSIEPTGDAAFRVVDDGRVELERGELYISSVQSGGEPTPVQGLVIETPDGTAHAAGTRFYIGSHSGPTPPNSQGPPTMKRLTRVLVLAGAVTLTNPLGSVTGNANDLLAADAKQAPAKVAAQANTDFAIDMYKQLSKENAGKNLFFSPYSISNALAMTVEGARGETALEMGKVLRFPDAALRIGEDAQLLPWQTSLIHTGFQNINASLHSDPNDPKTAATRVKIEQLRKQLAEAKKATASSRGDWKKYQANIAAEKKIIDELNKLSGTIDQFKLEVANALWGEKTYRIEKPYRDAISKFYDSGAIIEADFKGDFDGERLRINGWVEDKTNDRIKDPIPKGGLDELTRLVLVNAIYFKGDWDTPFEEKRTKAIDFTLADGKKASAKTMHAHNLGGARYGAFNADGRFFKTPRMIGFQNEKAPTYPGKDGFAVAELPYKGKELSMVLVAPMDAGGLDAIEATLSSDNLSHWLGKLEQRNMHVKLPKFKMETGYKLHESLPKMGMVRAFTDPREPNGADFTGMHNTEDRSARLYVSQVVHKAFLEVNEKGTEAAAATAVIMATATSAPISRPFTPTFSADRPFLMMIRHNDSGAILFMGRVMNPTAK